MSIYTGTENEGAHLVNAQLYYIYSDSDNIRPIEALPRDAWASPGPRPTWSNLPHLTVICSLASTVRVFSFLVVFSLNVFVYKLMQMIHSFCLIDWSVVYNIYNRWGPPAESPCRSGAVYTINCIPI